MQKPAAAPPSIDVTALPNDAEIVPKPFRKPVTQKPVGESLCKPAAAPPSIDVTALPNDAGNRSETFQETCHSGPCREGCYSEACHPTDSSRLEASSSSWAKGQSFFDEKVRSSIADCSRAVHNPLIQLECV